MLHRLTHKLRRQSTTAPLPPFHLDTPLIPLSGFEQDAWRIRHAVEGVQVFGSTGAGKTSGVGATLARAYLNHGFGGLVLTSKIDEVDLWRRYCEQTGRLNDLIVFSPESEFRFNFLRYESQLSGGGGLTENLVHLFMTLLEAAEGGQSKANDSFWDRSVRQLLRNAIDLILMAGRALSMPEIAAVIASGPQSFEQLDEPGWQQRSLCLKCLEEASLKQRAHPDYDVVERYWMQEFPGYDNRTRANVVQTFSTMADGFCRGIMRELFSTGLNICPEFTHHGKIIVLALPTKQYHELGRIVQVLFKYMWQRATERRTVNNDTRPVFLWADESQEFIVRSDADFQATARSARAATVYLTQTISGYYAKLGQGGGHYNADSFIANLGTKVFHANSDPATNEWAERFFAKGWTYRSNSSVSQSKQDDPSGKSGKQGPQVSSGSNPSLESSVLASTFSTLRTGGPANNLLVEALIGRTGHRWAATGKSHLKVSFQQQS